MDNHITPDNFVRWFRGSSPYINAFRGRTFVVAFGGEMLADAQFASLVHDIALLNSLGVRLVLVHGTRPQVERLLNERNIELRYVNGLRVTDGEALRCVKEAAGSVRVEIEALLSMGVANSPMAGARIRVVSGNVVTAKPLGVRDGTDYEHTGEVRRVDVDAINRQLKEGAIVLLSPLGYSPTGEVFNLSAEDVATAAAIQLGAEKLLFLVDGPGVHDTDGELVRELTPQEGEALRSQSANTEEPVLRTLAHAVHACKRGVRRIHLVDRHVDGALLLELFTRDGIGTMVTAGAYEGMRQATIEDVGGILELIEPLEKEGALVRRSRELLEMEIDHFTVIERDGMVIGCAALYPFVVEGVGEVACLAVHPDYQREGRADALLNYLARQARSAGITRLFVLTTRTAHWFQERGFVEVLLEELPLAKQQLYNYQRRSKVFIKPL